VEPDLLGVTHAVPGWVDLVDLIDMRAHKFGVIEESIQVEGEKTSLGVEGGGS